MATIIKTTAGAAAKFPFELKDAFRKAFPSAKWNAAMKQWEVSAKSVARLQQWIDQINASNIEAELAARDEAEMNEKEIASLEADVAFVRREIQTLRAQKSVADEARARAEELRANLDAARVELEAARAEKAAADEAAAAVVADIEARIAHIATRGRIEALRSELKKNWVPKAYARAPFEAAQEKLVEIYENLQAAGIECEAVRLACNVNRNRPDRDRGDLNARIEFVAA